MLPPAMESVIEIALGKGVAVEPAEFPSNKTEYAQQKKRGIQLFGPPRETEYQLLRSAAERALDAYR